MAPAAPKPAARKRNRKRKRRAYTSSSSSSSDDASDSGSSAVSATTSQKKPSAPAKAASPTSNSDDSDSEDTEDSDSDSSLSSEDSDEDEDEDAGHLIATRATAVSASTPKKAVRKARSPSPPPTKRDIPPFLPPSSAPGAAEKEQALKDNFRRFWMTSIAEGFKDDLEEIRKEPNLGPSRLALLIDSLASGAEVFGAEGDVDEMEVALNEGS